MKVKCQATLLLNRAVIARCLAEDATCIFLAHAQYVLDEELNHEMEKTSSSDGVVRYQTISFAVGTNHWTEINVGICEIQTQRVFTVCRRKCYKPCGRAFIAYQGP